jgi:glycosyltransferase involved in cell wall biosynthesis
MVRGKVSVIMPAFNESSHIVNNILETMSALNELGLHFEIILVDDGSHDETYLFAARVRADHPEQVRVVRYDENMGKGNALICGTRYASGDYVVFLDADMDLHPAQLPVFFRIMETDSADVVIGSKRHPESRVNYPTIRKIYSAVYYGMVRVLFGLPVRDTQTGLKLFKIDVLRRVFPRILAKRFAFDIEVLANAHRLGYRIVEAPVRLHFQRRFGRVRFHDAYVIFIDTLAIFYRMHLLHYYDRVQPIALEELPQFEHVREVSGITR